MTTRGRIIQVIQRGLGLTDEQAAAFSLRAIPTILLDDLTAPWQSDELSVGWGLFGAQLSAVAAEVGQYALENPAGSGKLVVMSEWRGNTASDNGWNFQLVTSAQVSTIAVSSNRATLDSRIGVEVTPLATRGLAAITRAESDPTLAIESAFVRNPAGQGPLVVVNAIISPGFAILIESLTANVANRMWYRWFEVPQVVPS